MPYNPNANWTAWVNAGAVSPVYYIAIEGLTTTHFSTGLVKSAAVAKLPIMNFPGSIGQKIAQLQGRTSLSLFTLELVNNGNILNTIFATEDGTPVIDTLINKRVTLYSGGAELVEADYAPIAVAQIRGVQIGKDSTFWEFQLVALRRAEQETIFLNADARGSSLTLAFLSDFNAGLGVFRVTGDPTTWRQGDRIYLGPSTDAANPGAEEKVTVQQVRDVTNEVFVNPVTTYKYKAGDPVRTASTLIEGNPYNIILAILTDDFANVSWPLSKAFGEPTGLGIPTADIDTAAIIKERDRMYPESEPWRFEITRPISGSRFLESELYRWLGYPTVLLSGKLSFRAFRPPYPDDVIAGLPTLTEADILSQESERNIDDHINRVVLGVDTSFGGGNPAQIVTVEETADQGMTDEESELREENTGLVGDHSGVRLAQGRCAVSLRRFLDGPFVVATEALPRKRAIQVGEDVLVTHSRIPNEANSTPGLVAKRLEVIERTEDPASGTLRLVVQDAGFVRPSFIGPSGAITGYDAASAAEREYCYIGPTGSPVGNFSDGTPPYEHL